MALDQAWLVGRDDAFGQKYRLLRRLGVGGMGEVFLARQTGPGGFDRLVAIKVLLPELAAEPQLVQRFVDEARIAAHLVHPNIVQVYELGRDGDGYFLAMEYVPGPNLARFCDAAQRAGAAFDRRVAVHIAREVLRALDFLHGATDPDGKPLRLVHRDVSPHNVLVSRHGDVKLMDFGIAQSTIRLSRTETGVVQGKLAYMAPEQAAGHRVDCRADLYAVGVLLWELSLQRRLFSERDPVETIRRVHAGEIPRPSTVDSSFPPGLERILLRTLARSPTQRPQSARELLVTLDTWLEAAGPFSRDELPALVRTLFPAVPTDSLAETTPGLGSDDVTLAAARTELTQPPAPAARGVPWEAQPAHVAHDASARLAPAHLPAGEPALSPRRGRDLRRVALWALTLTTASTGVALLVLREGARQAPARLQATAKRPHRGRIARLPAHPASQPVEQEAAGGGGPGAVATAVAGTRIGSRRSVHAPAQRPTHRSPRSARAHRSLRTTEPAPTRAARAKEPTVARALVVPEQALGVLVVGSSPWGMVSIDGREHGETDLQVQLGPGPHRVAVRLSSSGKQVAATAHVVAGRKTKCRVDQEQLRCTAP